MSILRRTLRQVFSSGESPGAALSKRVAPGQMFGDLQLKTCRYGPMLFLGPIIGKCFELYGEYSESEIELMRHFVGTGDSVIDIGANIGDLSVPLARMVGPEGAVYAFESHAEIFNVLCANLALNRLANVKPYNAFVRQARPVDVPLAESGSPYLSERWIPPAMGIDQLKLASCGLIKIDVDGVEEDVLRSGEELIRRTRPVLYVENDEEKRSPALLRYMAGLGYDLYWHAAPIFSSSNFFGNPDYPWSTRIVSTMILGIPTESGIRIGNLPAVREFDQFWDFRADWVNDQLVDGFVVQVLRPAGKAG